MTTAAAADTINVSDVSAQETLRARLRALSPLEVHIKDDSEKHRHHAEGGSGAHLRLRIVSARFEGLSPIKRHRLVYETAGDIAAAGIHALAITALAPHEARR